MGKINDEQLKEFDKRCEPLSPALKEIASKLKSKTNKSSDEINIITSDADLQTALIDWYKSQAKKTNSVFSSDIKVLRGAIITGKPMFLANINLVLERFKLCFDEKTLQDAEQKKASIEQMKKSLSEFGFKVEQAKPKKKPKKKPNTESENKPNKNTKRKTQKKSK